MKECIENNFYFLFTLKNNAGKDLQQELRDKIIGYNVPYKTEFIQVGRMLHHIKYRRVIKNVNSHKNMRKHISQRKKYKIFLKKYLTNVNEWYNI